MPTWIDRRPQTIDVAGHPLTAEVVRDGAMTADARAPREKPGCPVPLAADEGDVLPACRAALAELYARLRRQHVVAGERGDLEGFRHGQERVELLGAEDSEGREQLARMAAARLVKDREERARAAYLGDLHRQAEAEDRQRRQEQRDLALGLSRPPAG